MNQHAARVINDLRGMYHNNHEFAHDFTVDINDPSTELDCDRQRIGHAAAGLAAGAHHGGRRRGHTAGGRLPRGSPEPESTLSW